MTPPGTPGPQRQHRCGCVRAVPPPSPPHPAAPDVTLFAEFLPIKNRGLMLVLMHAFFGLGNLFIVTVAWLVVPTLGWRWLVAISATPAFLMLFARRAIPEVGVDAPVCAKGAAAWSRPPPRRAPQTPRYLLMSGQHDKAREVLMEVARYNKWEEHQVHNLKHLHLGLSHGRADVASSRLSHSQALGHLFRVRPTSAFFHPPTHPAIRHPCPAPTPEAVAAAPADPRPFTTPTLDAPRRPPRPSRAHMVLQLLRRPNVPLDPAPPLRDAQ